MKLMFSLKLSIICDKITLTKKLLNLIQSPDLLLLNLSTASNGVHETTHMTWLLLSDKLTMTYNQTPDVCK